MCRKHLKKGENTGYQQRSGLFRKELKSPWRKTPESILGEENAGYKEMLVISMVFIFPQTPTVEHCFDSGYVEK